MIINKLIGGFYKIFIKYPYYKIIMGSFGKKSQIIKPLRIDGSKNIFIGENVYIQHYTWLASMPLTNNKTPRLEIEDGAIIGHFNHIYCTNKIIIRKNALIADKVYISDNLHSYENTNIPISKQPIKQINFVEIGEGCWIGENASIIGACIGKGSIIGANSVVTKNIPDYCVAVGIPAKIIKKYNQEKNIWEKIY
ncbi:MAG: acyltransferase [Chitinophagaceae bacterium]